MLYNPIPAKRSQLLLCTVDPEKLADWEVNYYCVQGENDE